MASPIGVTGAGAALGLQDLVAKAQDERWKQAEFEARAGRDQENVRHNQAAEAYQNRALSENIASREQIAGMAHQARQDALSRQVASDAETRRKNEAEGAIKRIGLMPLPTPNRPVPVDYGDYQQFIDPERGNIPRQVFSETLQPPLSGDQGEQGPVAPGINYTGTRDALLQAEKEANDKARADAADKDRDLARANLEHQRGILNLFSRERLDQGNVRNRMRTFEVDDPEHPGRKIRVQAMEAFDLVEPPRANPTPSTPAAPTPMTPVASHDQSPTAPATPATPGGAGGAGGAGGPTSISGRKIPGMASPMPQKEATELRNATDAIDAIARVTAAGDDAKWEGTGLFTGRPQQFLHSVLGNDRSVGGMQITDSEAASKFRGEIELHISDLIHDKYGASFTKNEGQAAGRFLESVIQHPDELKVRLAVLKARYQDVANRRRGGKPTQGQDLFNEQTLQQDLKRQQGTAAPTSNGQSTTSPTPASSTTPPDYVWDAATGTLQPRK